MTTIVTQILKPVLSSMGINCMSAIPVYKALETFQIGSSGGPHLLDPWHYGDSEPRRMLMEAVWDKYLWGMRHFLYCTSGPPITWIEKYGKVISTTSISAAPRNY